MTVMHTLVTKIKLIWKCLSRPIFWDGKKEGFLLPDTKIVGGKRDTQNVTTSECCTYHCYSDGWCGYLKTKWMSYVTSAGIWKGQLWNNMQHNHREERANEVVDLTNVGAPIRFVRLKVRQDTNRAMIAAIQVSSAKTCLPKNMEAKKKRFWKRHVEVTTSVCSIEDSHG